MSAIEVIVPENLIVDDFHSVWPLTDCLSSSKLCPGLFCGLSIADGLLKYETVF